MWQYSAPITMPIFTAGAIAGQVQAAEAVQQQALFGYQKAIQEAFREVDDSLIDQDRTREQLAGAAAPGQGIAAVRLDGPATLRQRLHELHRSPRRRAQPVQRAAVYADPSGPVAGVINLYLAMGGGWVLEAEKETIPPPAESKG